MNKDNPLFYKTISLSLLVCSLINPIILFVIFENIGISSLVFIITSVLFLYAYFRIKKRYVFYLVLYVYFLLFLLLNGELIFRNNYKSLVINNLYESRGSYYFNKPNLNLVLENEEYQTIYKTDDFGFRIGHKNNSSIKKVNWLFIGDSYTQGAQVNFEELFTTKLSQKYPHVQIINAGISGFGLIEEYNFFKKEGIYLNPNKLFIQICVLNDFVNILPKENDLFDLIIEKSSLLKFIMYNYIYVKTGDLPLGRWTDPFFKDENDNINYNILYSKTSKQKLENLLKFEEYIRLIKEEADRINCKLYIILIPTKEQVYLRYFNEVVESFKIDTALININRSSRILEKITKENEITLIDPLYDFKNDTINCYFEIDEHLNTYGHTKLSSIIDSLIILEDIEVKYN